ncbi:MAG: hypothetical protein ACW990_00120 [Promethearchaeota archaeon]|jgi:hypothetical protein
MISQFSLSSFIIIPLRSVNSVRIVQEEGENNMYSETEMKFIEFTDEISTQERPICPECINHVQGEVGEVFDCKNLYRYTISQGIGQCCCYSITHGKNTR